MHTVAFIGTGVLFLLILATGIFVYAAATDAKALVRRKYPNQASELGRWNPNEAEGSFDSGAAFITFFFTSHKALGDPQIDRLCERVRWGTLLQLAFGVAFVYVLEHA